MVGLIFALVYVAWKFAFSSQTLEDSFLAASTFLYYWHWTWSIVLAVLVGLAILVITLGASAKGHEEGGIGGAIVGLLLGGGASVFLITMFAAQRALLLIGSYLMMTSGTYGMDFSQFDKVKIIFGSILMLVGIILGRARSSSNKKDD